MPIIGRFKNLFRGNAVAASKRPLVETIRYDVDPHTEWRVLGELGDGAFGTVEKVCSIDDPKQLAAAKCITIEPDESVEDMVVEIAVLSTCSHKNIVGLLDAFFWDNKLYMMLEFCSGGAVDNIMQELLKPLNEPQIAYITRYTCEALAYLHTVGVIHRDLKAGNILLTNDGTVKLADFGVSAKLKDTNERRNSFIGSPYWMAPEVMFCETFKDQPYDVLADIWSLGVTLIEMAQMDPPNYQISAMRIYLKVQKSEPPKLDRPAKWTRLFNDFLEHCLKKNPQERCAAEKLKAHPFVRDATSAKPIIALLCEKNADVKEEVVMAEDAESADGSGGGSVRAAEFGSSDELGAATAKRRAVTQPLRNGAKWIAERPVATAAAAAAASATTTRTPLRETNNVSAPSADVKHVPRKKFAAPQPPQLDENPTTRDVEAMTPPKQIEALTSLIIEGQHAPPSYTAKSVSPRKEAIEILDDLCNDLDNDDYDGRAQASAPASPQRARTTVADRVRKFSSGRDERDVSPHSRRHNEPPMFKRSCDALVPTRKTSEERDAKVHVAEIAANFNMRASSTSAPTGSTRSLQRPLSEACADVHQRAQPSDAAKASLHQRQSYMGSDHPSSSTTSNSSTAYTSTQQHSSQSDSGVETHDLAFSRVAPPPEPPVDYDVRAPKAAAAAGAAHSRAAVAADAAAATAAPHANTTRPRRVSDEDVRPAASAAAVSAANGRPKSLIATGVMAPSASGSSISTAPLTRAAQNRATVTRKTRTYVVDGVEVTSTSLHVLSAQNDYALRRKELQELKRLQRREARDQQLLNERNENDCELQERRANEYRNSILREYEAEREQLQKIQKRKMEDLERAQEDERRALFKNIKSIQEKEYREFQMALREETKRLKYEVDMLPRGQRKDVYKHRREMLERVHADQNDKFIAAKRTAGEKIKETLQRSHDDNLARLDRQFLNELHDLRRNVESALWEQERQQISERYNLRRQQLKDNFALQRSLMVSRHRMELERIRRTHQANEDLLIRSLATARKQMPKALRAESKTRIVMFKESLRINYAEETPGIWSKRIHNFEEAEKLRITQKLEDYDAKCRRRLDELRESNTAADAELEEIHHGKTEMIMSNESQKMTEYSREYEALTSSWERELPVRKRELEDHLHKELDEQAQFYQTGALPSMLDQHGVSA